MNRFSVAALCVLLATGCGEESAGTDTKGVAAKEVIFVSASLFIPGDGPPVENGIMIIEDGVIKQVGKKDEFYAPRGAARAELEGMTIAPLLINLHAYPGLGSLDSFGANNYKRETLSADLNRYGYYGVGAVLAGGDSDGLAMELRDEIREGKTTGARLYSSGRGIAAKGSSGHMGNIPFLVSGAADARKAVGDLAERNADAIVLWADGMKAEASDAVIDEAHKRKLKVFAHAPGLDEAKNLVKANVDALITSVRDRDVDDELVSMMREKKIPLAPGLTALESKFVYAERVPWLSEQAMREVYPASVSAYLSEPAVMGRFRRNPQLPAFKQEFATASSNLKKLADAGVPIVLGSGSGLADTFPGYFEHRELELMVNAGMTPLAAITAATSASAAAIGAEDLGVLGPGKRGSFVVFASNPLEKISNSRDIDRVFVGGGELDRLEMIRKFKIDRPQVSAADKANEQALQEQERWEVEDSKLKKYGKFALGPNTLNVAPGLVVQTPKRSTASASAGPPYKVTVQRKYANGAELQEFYSKLLPEARWTPAGECWEKPNLAQPGKKWRLCAVPGGSSVSLNISVQ
ncbi:MAG TPA: amidohydrolase family protein [Terriglobia bacterium]|nr:amidohydrolase family protein [Terriglobia bacterium]